MSNKRIALLRLFSSGLPALAASFLIAASACAVDVPVLTAPTGDEDGSYTVSWAKVAQATSFELEERAFTGSWSSWTEAYSGPSTRVSFRDEEESAREYRVRACVGGACGDWSDTRSVLVGVPKLDLDPYDLDGTYKVKWSALSWADLYELQEYDNGTTGHTSTAYKGADLQAAFSAKPDGFYGYIVRGCRGAICGAWSGGGDIEVGGWLTADPNPSPDGSYAVSWDVPEFKTGGKKFGYTYSLRHCAGSEAQCGALSDYVEVSRISNSQHAVSAQEEGTHNYRLRACAVYEDDDGNEDTLCEWSETLTVTVAYAVGSTVGTANATGAMDYQTGVTRGGDAYINIPVTVVPGVNGLAPHLSIDYSDGRERQRADEDVPGDLLGYGWRIGGLSAIRRCVRGADDSDGISLDASDKLCIDGEPLVLVGGTHLAVGAKYRTLRESFTRIEIKGEADAFWFRVELPDGRVREYGRTPDSELKFASFRSGTWTYTVPILWSMNRETDAFGNTMRYEYRESEDAGVRVPARILYGDSEDAEVVFHYTGRSDLADVMLGNARQKQWLRLHLVEVRLDGRKVREYRLVSERTSQGWRRLSKIQLCAYRKAGAGIRECLEPLSVLWETQAAGHMKTSVSKVVDALGRETSFKREVLTNSGSHNFLFGAGEENLFGAGAAPKDAAPLAADSNGRLKPVVTQVSRQNGVGGLHRTTYAYQGRGWRSTKGWGFLGFRAMRATDEASGVSTYMLHRLDFPHFGRSAAVVAYEGKHGASGSEVLSKRFLEYGSESISHGGGSLTHMPYLAKSTELLYEDGTLLGAKQATDTPTLKQGLVSKSVRTESTGHGASASGSEPAWGYSVTGVQRRSRTTTEFDNVATSSAWLSGFPKRIVMEDFAGSGTTAERKRTTSRTRAAAKSGNKTNAVKKEVVFPGDEALKLTTTYSYDKHGNLESTTVAGGTKGYVPSRETEVDSFDSARYPDKVTNAEGHAQRLKWDAALGLPTRITDANGRVLEIAYDAFGREVLRRRAWDSVTETTDYVACTSSTCGSVAVGASDCFKARTADLAMKATTTSPDAPAVARYYDELGRVVRTSVQSFASGTVHRSQDVLRDSRGLVACASAPYHTGATRSYQRYGHDARGRMTSLKKADGGSFSVAYSADGTNHRILSRVTESVLGERGKALPRTRQKLFEHNVLGELVESTDGAEAPNTADRSITRYTYDGSGLLKSVTVENGAVDYATAFTYDEAGRRTGVSNPNHADESFAYTALGELRTRKDARGTTTWEYDLLGRTTSRTDPGGGAAKWNWDPSGAKGLLSKRTYDDGATSLVEFEEAVAYDSDERPKSVTTTLRLSATESEVFKVSYAYDSLGRLSSVTHPSGLSETFSYNARGYIEKRSKGLSALVEYTGMDAWGNVTGEAYGNGVKTARAFDARTGRVTGISTAKGSATIQDEDYGWRSDGLLESRESGGHRETFGYDHLGRLVSAKTFFGGATTAGRTLSHGYDRLGSLKSLTSDVSADSDTTSMLYAGTGAAGPTAVTSASLGGVATTFTYDASGHITRYDAASGDDTHIEWNGRGLPARITVGDSASDATPAARDEFRYGPSGERYYRRITWQESGTDDGGSATVETRTTRVYRAGAYEKIVPDDSAEHAWVDTTSLGAARLVRAQKEGASSPSSAFEYLHADHLGSPAAATDASGSALSALAHDPFGARRESNWSAQLGREGVAGVAAGQDGGRTRRGFTGHEPLDRTGFIHMGGRLYDPRMGRFLSPDPIISEAWTGQGWNLYSYVGNSPVSRTDPTGYCYQAGPACPQSGDVGGGFASQTVTLATAGVSAGVVSVPVAGWSWVSFGGWGDYGGGGFFAPTLNVLNIPYVRYQAGEQSVSLGQESAPADAPLFTARELASLAVGFIPVAGSVQSVVELVTGYDYIAGEPVDRRLAAAGVLAGVVPGGKAGVKLGARAVPDDELEKIAGKFFPTKPRAENPALQRTIDELFRESDTVPGGTAGALRVERITGEPIKGKFHFNKAKNRLQNLNNILGRKKLSPSDFKLAKRLQEDLMDALGNPNYGRDAASLY